MIDNKAQQIHPARRLTTPNGAEADIDVEMVPLVRTLWALDLTTTASCQDFGEGTAGQRSANRHGTRYGQHQRLKARWAL